MKAFLLSVHVVAAILFVGPVAVAASLFPRFAPLGPDVGGRDGGAGVSPADVLHRVTAVYGRLALVVPLVGLVLAAVQGRTSETWVVVAMVLTAIAGALLVLQVVPRQREALDAPGGGDLRRMRMLVGVFNLLWVVVVVLMIVRPGTEYR